MIARGKGRSYGDAATLKDGEVLLTERLNRFLAFDENTGVLTAEAGVTIEDVLSAFVPRGWFPSVTPGTKFVSLGGCVATDVHGKNHHRKGAFSKYVESLELVLADGNRKTCSRDSDPDLFWATVGGIGLTGIILEVTLRLKRIETAFMVVENHVAPGLESMLRLLESEAKDDESSVAWIDCFARGGGLGRGIVMCGHHAARIETPGISGDPLRIKARPQLDLPFDFPSSLLHPRAVASFNELYYRWHGRRTRPSVIHYDAHYYPLDIVGSWNRLYGRNGFLQYQCVLPTASAHDGIRELMELVANGEQPCFLGVLKRFGEAGGGLLSFPLSGYTLALDFPLRNERLLPFLGSLDEVVIRHGGRVYLAKDARLDAEAFRSMYPSLDKWRNIKASVDPKNRFRSDLSGRLRIEADE